MKTRQVSTTLSYKQAAKIKRFKDSQQPCTVIHHLICDSGSAYESRIDCLNGYNEQQIISGINASIATTDSPVNGVLFISIMGLQPKPDDSEYQKLDNKGIEITNYDN